MFKQCVITTLKKHRSGTTGLTLTNEITKCFCFCDLYMKINCETFGWIKKNQLNSLAPGSAIWRSSV